MGYLALYSPPPLSGVPSTGPLPPCGLHDKMFTDYVVNPFLLGPAPHWLSVMFSLPVCAIQPPTPT